MDLSRRLLVSIVVAAAVAGTVGYVREHEGTPTYVAAVTGQAREIGGLSAGQAATQRILAGTLIAERLHDTNVFPARAAELRRAMNIEVQWPRFTITARGNSSGYAALLARTWAEAVTPLLGALLRDDPDAVVDKLGIPAAERGAVKLAFRRERALARRPAAAALSANDPLVEELTRLRAVVYEPLDVLAAVTAPTVPEQAVNRGSVWHLLLWLSAGAGAGALISLISGAVFGARGTAVAG